jgi:hypothetical protein
LREWRIRGKRRRRRLLVQRGSTCSNAEHVGQTKRPDSGNENQIEGEAGGIEEDNGNGTIKGIEVVITTSKDVTTTTILSAEPNTNPRNVVEIVTKTVIRGDMMKTLITTALVPLALRTVLQIEINVLSLE